MASSLNSTSSSNGVGDCDGPKEEPSMFDVYELSDDDPNLGNNFSKDIWEKINDQVEEILHSVGDERNDDNNLSISCKISKYNVQEPTTPTESNNRILPVANSKYTACTSSRLQVDNNPNVLRKSMLELVNADIDDRLISAFRQGMHCSDTCIVRVVDRCGILKQSYLNRTISMVCIDRKRLESFVSQLPDNYQLRITRLQNSGAIQTFQTSRVFHKRSVIKGGDILRTLAVFEIRENFDQQYNLQKRENKKVLYNRFTNMQRLDRGVGSRLKWKFMERHDISETDTIQVLEDKANVSFSIFKRDGFLCYESKKYRQKHVTMLESAPGLYYFIPTKMLTAFGSQWAHRRRKQVMKYLPELYTGVRNPSTVLGFHPQRMHLQKQNTRQSSPDNGSRVLPSTSSSVLTSPLSIPITSISPVRDEVVYVKTQEKRAIKVESDAEVDVERISSNVCISRVSKRLAADSQQIEGSKKLKIGNVTLKVVDEGGSKPKGNSNASVKPQPSDNYIRGEIISTSNEHVVLRIPVSSISLSN